MNINKKDFDYKSYNQKKIEVYANDGLNDPILINDTFRFIEYSENETTNSQDSFNLGQTPSKEFSLSFMNYKKDKSDLLDISKIDEYIFTKVIKEVDENGNEFVLSEDTFKIFEPNESYSEKLDINCYDYMVMFDQPYNSKLEYPTTVLQQVNEISKICNVKIDTLNLNDYIKGMEIDFYDNTISCRNYLGWISEINVSNFVMNNDVAYFKPFLETNEDNIVQIPLNIVSVFTTSNKWICGSVIFEDGLQKFKSTMSLIKTNDEQFEIIGTTTKQQITLETNIEFDVLANETYTFSFECNCDVDNVENTNSAFVKLVNVLDANDYIEFLSKETTFTVENENKRYKMIFISNNFKEGESYVLSNYDIVQGEVSMLRMNTLYIRNDNLYVLNENVVENVFNQVVGVEFVSLDSADLIKGNPMIKLFDNVHFLNNDMSINSKCIVMNNSFSFNNSYNNEIGGKIASKNVESTVRKFGNDIKIKNLQVTVDRNNNLLNILNQNVEENNAKITEFEITLDDITLSVENMETTVQDNVEKINENSSEILQNSNTISFEVNEINKNIAENVVEIYETTNNLQIAIDGLTNTVTNTGGNNLIRDSVGLFNDESWIGVIEQDSNIDLNVKNLYSASLLVGSNIEQDVKVVNGAYTLKFDYVKYVLLANTRVKINDIIYSLDSSEIDTFVTHFNVDNNMVSIEFLTDTVGSLGVTNIMLNQGTDAQIWSLNSNETFTDTVKIGRGVTIGATGSNVTFEAQADIIGFKNKSDIYTATFDENGASMNEIIVKNKGVITGCLFQEINNQTTINYIGGDN